jgi:hypothetical protein
VTADRSYTTQLGAGLGLVRETKVLLDLWTPDRSRSELKEAALQSGLFPSVTARRLRNIVIECFKPRYLVDDARPARYLKTLQPVLTSAEFNQLLFLYTCRANPILADFVREVYWERYAASTEILRKEDARALIRRGVDDGKTIKRWSDAMIVRVSNYLLGTCADYGLLGKLTRSGRRILPFRIEPKVATFLAHDLHFKGVGDSSLLAHEEWQLFGLQREEVRSELRRLALRAQIILQSAGSVTHIGWHYKSMQDFVDVLAQS